MREWQSLPQASHVYAADGVSVCGGVDLLVEAFFLLARFSAAASIILSSPAWSCVRSVLLQCERSDARSSQESVSMFRFFMSLLQTSLNLSLGHPVFLFPAVSSP